MIFLVALGHGAGHVGRQQHFILAQFAFKVAGQAPAIGISLEAQCEVEAGQPVGQLHGAFGRQLRRFCQWGREVCLAFQIEVFNPGWQLAFWLKNRCGAKKVALKARGRGCFHIALQPACRQLCFVRACDVHFAL